MLNNPLPKAEEVSIVPRYAAEKPSISQSTTHYQSVYSAIYARRTTLKLNIQGIARYG
jgi:hypothetical protein